jgi:hypothetical protein
VLNRTVLANLAATGIGHLAAVIKHGLKRLQYRPALLDGCLAGTGLRLHTQPGPAGCAVTRRCRRRHHRRSPMNARLH